MCVWGRVFGGGGSSTVFSAFVNQAYAKKEIVPKFWVLEYVFKIRLPFDS
jgi:hypothetical protein